MGFVGSKRSHPHIVGEGDVIDRTTDRRRTAGEKMMELAWVNQNASKGLQLHVRVVTGGQGAGIPRKPHPRSEQIGNSGFVQQGLADYQRPIPGEKIECEAAV